MLREIANKNIFGFQFVFLQPFPCSEIMIIDPFLVALLSFVCLVLTDSSSLVTRLDKISTSLVECEHVKAKIGKALHADGSPHMWKKLPPARGQKGFLS